MICVRRKMKKGEKKKKQEALNLLEMYKMKLTPERKVEAFRRYVIKLKQQRNFGRDLSYYEYMNTDIRLFREEALYMKGLDVEYDMHVRLSKEIRCLEEMSDEQILCYYTLVKRFQNNIIERADMLYARYYLLELANLIYQETPKEAYDAMFSFWDALEAAGKISDESKEYFYTICRLFMLAFPELMPKMIARLEERTGRDWSGRAYAAVEKGEYEVVEAFIRQNARGLKENERYPEKEYAIHAWKALPYVFRMLERDLKVYDFRHMILNGFYASVYIGDYPVMCGRKIEEKIVQVSKYMYYEYQDFSDYWKFWYYVLRESVQDLLYMIYQCTETRMRWHLKAPARKGSVNRIISKTYVTGTDRPQDVARIKELLKDEQFQEFIEDGVLDYLTTEEVPLPERKKRSRRTKGKSAQELDYEKIDTITAIDPEKLKQAKEDAEQVLGMLSDGEIAYDAESAVKRQSEMFSAGNAQNTAIHMECTTNGITEGSSGMSFQNGQAPVSVIWSDMEKHYLRLLRTSDQAAAKEYLRTLQMPESVMMKNINNKALELFGDFLLEKEAGALYILEDYEEETDRILGEGP